MHKQLAQALQLADRGSLEEAIAALHQLLADESQLDYVTRAAAFELLGRCELGVLCNVQAMVSFNEAAQCYKQCGLMQVRKLLDDRQLREARSRLTPVLREGLAMGWGDVLSLGLEFLGLLCFHTKELRKAAGLLEEALARGDSRKLSWETLVVKLGLANCYHALGNVEGSAKLLAEITDDPRYQQIPRVTAFVLMKQGYDAYLAGDFALARQFFEHVVVIAAPEQRSPKGLAWLCGMASYNLGLLAIEQQDYLAARRVLQDVIYLTRHQGYYQLLCGSLTALCVVELMLDHPLEALQKAQVCQEYVNQFGDIETRLADYFLGLVYLAVNQLDYAQVLWLYKPVLEDNQETQMQYRWMRRILDHLRDSGGGAPFNLTAEALALVQRWLDEIKALASPDQEA
jgi:tetratricopeptide (TPR) repeat protein